MILKPEPWREHAVHARVIAECMNDPDCKRDMLEIAKRYDRIARRIESRQLGVVIPLPRRGVE